MTTHRPLTKTPSRHFDHEGEDVVANVMKYPNKLNTQCRPEAWRAVVLRDEADALLAAILTLSAGSLEEPAEIAA